MDCNMIHIYYTQWLINVGKWNVRNNKIKNLKYFLLTLPQSAGLCLKTRRDTNACGYSNQVVESRWVFVVAWVRMVGTYWWDTIFVFWYFNIRTLANRVHFIGVNILCCFVYLRLLSSNQYWRISCSWGLSVVTPLNNKWHLYPKSS